MAKIKATCPHCSAEGSVDAQFIGKRGRCPRCGQSFVMAAPASGDASGAGRWKPGDTLLDLYEVKGLLGEGGMGAVYQVRHKGWNLDLAVKVPRPQILQRAGAAEDFEREAETWVNLGLHPHAASCYYVRRLDGLPLVFAELVDGGSLKDWINTGKLYEGGPDNALARILDIAIQFAWGLHFAHEQGLVHQDVKPGNVLMTRGAVAKVTDFGLARAQAATQAEATPPAGPSTLVSFGGMTPAYCSPEQAARARLSRQTDVWSWAVSVLEMFTGDVTWPSGTVAGEALEAHLAAGGTDTPPMPADVAELLRRCLRHEPNARPATTLEIADALAAAYAQATGAAYARLAPRPAEARADALNNRAASLLDLGRPADAERLWNEALACHPHHPEATYNLGLLEWRETRIADDALLVRLREVAAAATGVWLPAYLLAQIHLERYDSAAAVEALQGLPEADRARDEVGAALAAATDRAARASGLERHFAAHFGLKPDSALTNDSRYRLLVHSESRGRDEVEVRRVDGGKSLHRFQGHKTGVNSVAVSGDGRLALSGGHGLTVIPGGKLDPEVRILDQSLKLWELTTGNLVREFGGEVAGATCVALSADGRLAATVHWADRHRPDDVKEAVRLWDTTTGTRIGTLQGHTGPPRTVALTPDGRYALTCGEDWTVRYWEVATRQCLRCIGGHQDTVRVARFTADGGHALSFSDDRTLRLWHIATGRCMRTLDTTGHLWGPMVWSPDGRRGGFMADPVNRNCPFVVYDIGELGPPYRAPVVLCRAVSSEKAQEAEQAYAAALREADAALARGDTAAAVRHLRQARAQPEYANRPEALERWSGLYARQRRRALRAVHETAAPLNLGGKVNWLRLSPDQRRLLTQHTDPKSYLMTVRLYERASGERVDTFAEIPGGQAVWCADGRRVLCTQDWVLHLRDVVAGSAERIAAPVQHLIVSADASLIGALDHEKLQLWDAVSGQGLRTFDFAKYHQRGKQWALSPCGRLVVTGSHPLILVDLATGRTLRTFAQPGAIEHAWTACWSPDGSFVLARQEAGPGKVLLCLWDVASGRCSRIIEQGGDVVHSVALSGDGRFALTGAQGMGFTGVGHHAKLWELSTGRCLWTIEGRTAGVTAVCFSADARLALTGDEAGVVRQWLLDWELDDAAPADWDEGARPFVENFLTRRSAAPSGDRPRAKLTVTKEDFQALLFTLGCAGYGWLRPAGVRRELERLAAGWKGPPPLPGS